MLRSRKVRAVAGALVVCCARMAWATEITVPDPNQSIYDIQDALNLAVSGDTIIISPGTYVGSGNVNLLVNKDITIRSTDPNDPNVVSSTIIDGEGQSRGWRLVGTQQSPLTNDCEILGLTFTNCYFDYTGQSTGGGAAIYCNYAAPTVRHCAFSDNQAIRDATGGANIAGGALLLLDCANGGTAVIEECTFDENQCASHDSTSGGYAGAKGGAAACINSPASFLENVFTYNAAGPTALQPGAPGSTTKNYPDYSSYGGAIYLSGAYSWTFEDNTFQYNTARYHLVDTGNVTRSTSGGAVYVGAVNSATWARDVFEYNESIVRVDVENAISTCGATGGAFHATDCDIQGCAFLYNTAEVLTNSSEDGSLTGTGEAIAAGGAIVAFNETELSSYRATGLCALTEIRNNTATVVDVDRTASCLAHAFGGGIAVRSYSVTIAESQITGNLAKALVYTGTTDQILSVDANSTGITEVFSAGGGGIALDTDATTTRIFDTLIADNTAIAPDGNDALGGGLLIGATSQNTFVRNCTIVANDAYCGGGVAFAAYGNNSDPNTVQDANVPVIWNSILWDNSATNGPQLATLYRCWWAVKYSCVEGGLSDVYNTWDPNYATWWNDNLIMDPNDPNDHPHFKDPNNGDYHLLRTSPCIDASDPNSTALDPNEAYDFDMHPRPQFSDPNNPNDIGADEVLLLGDMNCDGSADYGDINPFVDALAYPETYAADYPCCDILAGDLSGNGTTGYEDINLFVELLTS